MPAHIPGRERNSQHTIITSNYTTASVRWPCLGRRALPVEELRTAAAMSRRLYELRNHCGFRERTEGRSLHERGTGAIAEHPAGKTGVEDVEFRALPDSLTEVPVVGWEQVDEPAGDEDVQPPARGGRAHPDISSEACEVQYLSARSANEREERTEGLQVSDLLDVAEVAFQIGLHVAFHPQSTVHVRIEPGFGVGAPEQPVAEVETERPAAAQMLVQQLADASRRGRAEHFGDRQRIERQHRDSSRQGLAHSAHQREVLRAGQQPAAGLALRVDVLLQIVEKLRRVLDFVEDGARPRIGEKAGGIFVNDVAYAR